MKKQVLNTFIDKYSLNGSIESVKWVVDNSNKQIKTSSISDDKNALSYVTIKDDAGLVDSEFGINDTTKLKKLLNVLSEEVTVAFNKREEKIVSLSLNSEGTDVQYVTADLSVIPKVPDLKKLPPFNLEIPLTKEFVTTFVKAKSALSDVDTMTFSKDKKDKIKLTIGYSNVNSNRINIDVKPSEGKDSLGKTIHFSAKYLKEILTSNSDCENAVLKISDHGILHVEFNNDLFNSSYYLIEIKSVD
jgi:hypothetical protein